MSDATRNLLRAILAALDNEAVMESKDYVELMQSLGEGIAQRLENYFVEVNK